MQALSARCTEGRTVRNTLRGQHSLPASRNGPSRSLPLAIGRVPTRFYRRTDHFVRHNWSLEKYTKTMASESTALLAAESPATEDGDVSRSVGGSSRSYGGTTPASDRVSSRQTSWPVDRPPLASDGSTGAQRRTSSAYTNRWKSLTVSIGLTSIFLLVRVS